VASLPGGWHPRGAFPGRYAWSARATAGHCHDRTAQVGARTLPRVFQSISRAPPVWGAACEAYHKILDSVFTLSLTLHDQGPSFALRSREPGRRGGTGRGGIGRRAPTTAGGRRAGRPEPGGALAAGAASPAARHPSGVRTWGGPAGRGTASHDSRRHDPGPGQARGRPLPSSRSRRPEHGEGHPGRQRRPGIRPACS
jgi:hypothetical protein